MKFRVRFEKQRFSVEVEQENGTVENLKEAICGALSISDISLIQVSLNGKDIIEEDDIKLRSLGVVNGDLVYAMSPKHAQDVISDRNATMLSQLVDMGFDKEQSEHALSQIGYTSIEAAIDLITSNEVIEKDQTMYDKSVDDQPSTSGATNVIDNTCNVAANVCNPVFCRDGVSATLEMLYNNADVKTHHQAVFVLIHALMLESGFSLKDNERQKLRETLPLGWNNNNIVKLSYLHHISSSISSHLVFSSLGPFVCVYGWSEEAQSNTYEVKLIVSQYVRGDVPLHSGAKSIYRSLYKVSRVVKNHLVYPLLARIQSHLGITSPFSLSGLPPEVQLMILSQLNVSSLVALSSTCKALNVVCNDENLWKFFCQRDFGVKNKTETNWKKQYKLLYKRRQHLERDRSQGMSTFQPEFPLGFPGFNPFMPQAPGIIGGPYDLFPDLITGQPRDESSLRILHPDNRSRSDIRLRPRSTQGTFFA